MKKLKLILLFSVVATPALATFELDDPAEPGKEVIEPRETPLFGKWGGKDEVIIAPGTKIYAPKISNKQCVGWRQPGAGSSSDGADQAGDRTTTTYIGKVVSKVDCQAGDQSKSFSIVETKEGQVLWVESSQLLSAD